MHAFYASGRQYNHSQRVLFRLLWCSQPVFWTSACCSFNWVTADTKGHKSNFRTLSFGTSTQRGNIYRQLSEKWSSAIWHKQSSSLCRGSKAASVCRSVRARFALSLFPFKTKSKTHTQVHSTSNCFCFICFFYHEKHENEGIHMNIFSFVFQGNMDICSKTFKTGQHFICQSSQKRSVSSGCSRTCFWSGVCSGNPFVQRISMKHEHYWLWLNVGPKMVLRASGLQQKQPHSICLQHPICLWHKSPVVLLAPSIRSPQTQNCNQKMIKTKY